MSVFRGAEALVPNSLLGKSASPTAMPKLLDWVSFQRDGRGRRIGPTGRESVESELWGGFRREAEETGCLRAFMAEEEFGHQEGMSRRGMTAARQGSPSLYLPMPETRQPVAKLLSVGIGTGKPAGMWESTRTRTRGGCVPVPAGTGTGYPRVSRLGGLPAGHEYPARLPVPVPAAGKPVYPRGLPVPVPLSSQVL
ncbi:hypothetical protein FB45DRAFT_863220 [Roridomyces roridus]|uniref:Uncharacterized protein n=1 Tax=Roridomyces roridus TaxID=1738132 RepID=A0AAD7FWZ5_9AGAR|nr:hypothetical protein FB45DRAFT_863220 [Roridomyces roridus]